MVSKKYNASRISSGVLSALLLLIGCGGQGDYDVPPPTPAPAPPAPQPEPPAPAPAPPPPPTAPAPDPAPPAPAPEGVTLAATYTDLVDSGTAGAINWPDVTGTGAPIAGVNCMVEPIASHEHALVSIYRDGVRLALPHSIGIVPNCTYELHTHHRSGVVHVEPNVAKPLTLGQFFAVWGQPLSTASVAGLAGPVRYYMIENETLTRFQGNPAEIVFKAGQEIIIVTGSAPIVLPRYRWPEILL